MPVVREYLPNDSAQVNALALLAFEQFKDSYHDWPAFQEKIGNLFALVDVGEVIVAAEEGQIIGAVAYVGPGVPKPEFFRPEWPIMRMLVVAPDFRGRGIGRALAQECLRRAKRDGASVFALHTSELMHIALPMYQRMDFKWKSAAPMIHGVKYDVYAKEIDG
ncbi:MAG: GNAT family N-acetyltransferase [Gammaproteobacteria bacterium]|nr:GNAT family N-acetyltransferase [Gammaproteobacteria bacterium]MBU1731480.1 GNAT family N-acetyltransferase [Gammaproteobacteria bacterium]MBU1892985.1 GNAT family N-acetyltransferase [Gammaproteobacteria bacterium]